MQVRCYRCSLGFSLSAEEVAFVLEALEDSGAKHYDVRCTRCRTINKVSIEQLRRVAPPAPQESQEEGEETAE